MDKRSSYFYRLAHIFRWTAAISFGLYGGEVVGAWHLADPRFFLFASLITGSWTVVFLVKAAEEREEDGQA